MPTKIELIDRPIASILPAKSNARTHSRKQIRQIADAIKTYGFVAPISVSGDPLRIVAGHGRLAAAKLLGLSVVPTITIDGLSETELRALALADNRLATLSGWDRELLAIEFSELSIAAPEMDLSITGFELDQIELIQDAAASKSRLSPTKDTLPELKRGMPTTRLGDLWIIGEHRLVCGNALEPQAYRMLLGDTLVDVALADSPYNVPISGHVSSQGFDEFQMASGEMTREQFQRFLAEVCRLLVKHSRSGSLHYLFMDWRSIVDLVAAGEEHFAQLMNIIVWVKPVGGMGSLYRSRHEMVALFKNGAKPHTNNVELGANGRNRTNVWEYPGVNGFGADRKLGALHPTVKNVDMIADAIRDSSKVGELVLDPFGGSGTTLIAAHRTKRRSRLMELDPRYCDLIIQRAIDEGLAVSLAATGASFTEVERERATDPSSGDDA